MSEASTGIVGYGRFGRALGGLLDEAELPWRAFDPRAEVPAEARAGSQAELLAACGRIVVAVPVARFDEVVRELAPGLSADQVVIDVCSVKTGPTATMSAALGQTTPWVATHPLFGPSSLAYGQRPLTVVVCPNPSHPHAIKGVQAFWERIGCTPFLCDVETHDRVMAESHALTFFVAKGMTDAGLGEEIPFAPPSFQAMARTIESVRSDAGHLFATLHRQNPYSAEVRARFLSALRSIDQVLEEPEDPAIAEGRRGPELLIPDLGTKAPELRETRELIDELDHELVMLLARRMHLARRAGRVKHTLGHGVRDPVREATLLEARRAWGQELGVDPGGVDDVFAAILRLSRRSQREDLESP